MNTIVFPGKASKTLPKEAQEAYYKTHFTHVKNYLSNMGEVQIIDEDTSLPNEHHNNNFLVKIGDKKVIFDYSDFDYFTINFTNLSNDIKYFKIHTTEQSNPNCLPFPAMSFMDWSLYDELKNDITYNPNGCGFYKCNIYGGAVERRTIVKEKLKKYRGLPIDFRVVEQKQYFKSFNNCRINIVVPGARKDILDRTHLQSFAFGIPVITPKLSTLLPFHKRFEPNVDFIECLPDYSNLIDLIEKYKSDKSFLDFISNNCKNKFRETCSPEAVKNWILENI